MEIISLKRSESFISNFPLKIANNLRPKIKVELHPSLHCYNNRYDDNVCVSGGPLHGQLADGQGAEARLERRTLAGSTVGVPVAASGSGVGLLPFRLVK